MRRRIVLAVAIGLGLVVTGAAAFTAYMAYIHLEAADESGMRQSEIIGDRIVAQIASYEQDHGRYPNSLTDLVPKYLPAVPPPAWGERSWEYLLDRDKRSFVLRVTAKRFPYTLTYTSHDRRWSRPEDF